MKKFSGFRICFLLLAFIFLGGLLAQPVVAATVTWSGGGGDENWFNGENWQGGLAPLTSDDAIIPGGAPFYPNLTGGGFGIVNVTIQNGGTVTLSDGAFVAITGTLRIEDGGSFAIPGSNLSGVTIGSLDILFGGTLSLTGNFSFIDIGGGSVSGEIVISPPAAGSPSGIFLVGNLSLLSGGSLVLEANGEFGLSSGGLNVGDGATAIMNGGELFVDLSAPGLEIAANGLFEMNGGTLNVGNSDFPGSLNNDGEFFINGGTILVSSNSTFGGTGNFSWNNGEISTPFSGTDSFSWTNTGQIEIQSGGAPTLTNCTFINENILNLNSGSQLLVSDETSVGVAQFQNGSSGFLTGEGTIQFAPSLANADNSRLLNNGTVAPGGTGAIGTLDIIGDFENGAGGTVETEYAAPSGISEADNLSIIASALFGGQVFLAGAISASPLSGTFSSGEFPVAVISYQSRTGIFSTENLNPPDGFVFNPINYGPLDSPGTVLFDLFELPTVELGIAEGFTSDVLEGDSTAIVATASIPWTDDTVIPLIFSGTADIDFDVSVDNFITIFAGETTGILTIVAVDDPLFEGNETLTVTIDENLIEFHNPVGTPVDITILDDEASFPEASLALSGPDAIDELLEESTTLTVQLDAEHFGDIEVFLSYGGPASDATIPRFAAPDSVTIPAGALSADFQVAATNNGLEDGPRILRVFLSEGTGYFVGEPMEAEITITDFSVPEVALTLATGANSVIAEGESTAVAATLDAPWDAEIVVPLVFGGQAEKDVDFTADSSIRIPAGETVGLLTVEALFDDDYPEGDESFAVAIDVELADGFAPVGEAVSITILDVSPPRASLALAGPNSLNELLGESTTLTVELDSEPPANLEVFLSYGGPASDTTLPRFAAPTSVTIPAGQTSASFQITATNNELSDGSQRLLVSLVEEVGYLLGDPAELEIFITDGPLRWNGSLNTAWEAGENWDGGRPPGAGEDVLIPLDAPNFPVFPNSVTGGNFGKVTVEGELEIESGASFSSTLEIEPGGEVRNLGNLFLFGESYNSGLLAWSGGSVTVGEGGFFVNDANAEIRAENQNAASSMGLLGPFTGEFLNAGTFVKSGAGDVRIGVADFENQGILSVSEGRLNIGPTEVDGINRANHKGELRLANGAEIFLDSGSHNFFQPAEATGSLAITGAGAVVVKGSAPFSSMEFPYVWIGNSLLLETDVTLELISGTVDIGDAGMDPIAISGGEIFIGSDGEGNFPIVNVGADLILQGMLRMTDGNVAGAGNLSIEGAFQWTGGRMEGSSSNGNPLIQVDDLSTTGSSFLGGAAASTPSMELVGRDLLILTEMGVGNGRMELGRSANIQIGMEGAGGAAVFRVDNDPAVGMTFATYESDPGFDYGVVNYGTIGGNGKLAFSGGASGVAPFFDNLGTIGSGNSPVGVLIIDEENYNHSDGEFAVDILGPTDAEFDRIEITGFVELGGTLSVALEFDPEFGQEFRFLSTGGFGETIQFFQRNLTIGGVAEPFENFFEVVPDFETNEYFLRYVAETPLFSTLNLAVNPEGGGTVEANASLADGSAVSLTCPETCQEALRTGTAVVLTAIPKPGYQFVQWLDTAGLISDPFSSSTSLALSQDVTVTAEFVLDQAGTFNLDIAIQPPGSGSVTGQYTLSDLDPETEEPITETISFSCPEECAVAIPAGAGVSLSASPAAGFGFSGWQGVDEANGTSATLFMESNRQVTAAFFQPTPPPVDDNDRDNDGTIDPLDGCPDDFNKIEPGFCGCGELETDTDGDETPDCVDDCPEDEDKTEPGLCGCGTPETDSDGDGTPDCLDECPENPEKTEPGLCGCEVSEEDTDGDGVPDCIDECPEDPEKIEPGACGCGVSEEDTDGDGAPDCIDECPDDAFKVAPGACGCNVPETDSDGDQIPDCVDGCPGDPEKSAPGACGCGVPENGDRDGDGVPDCVDRCPDDPGKGDPGACGCGIPDIDADADGIPDCLDPDAPPNPDFPPLIPGEPQLIGPADGAFLDSPDVTLEGSIFFTGGGGEGLETHWWFRSADKRCEYRDMQRTTFGGIVKFSPDGLIPGLQYNWRLGYRDPQTGEMVWTDLRTFTIGEPEILAGPEIEPGSELADYRMRTFNAWSVPPDIVALLSDFVGEYDPRFFRIGGWDPELGEYVEFTEDLAVFPGRAYWFLAREGLMPEFPGVAVSLDADVNVNLFFSETTQTGWNQIASPNDADYRWEDVELVAFEPTEDPNEFRRSFGPVPLSELPADNPYIELELWRFVEDTYVSMLPGEPESVVLGGEGYWVAAKRDNICLVFRKAAQDDLDAEETMMVRTLRNFRRFAADQLGPRVATAQSSSPPPRPMGELEAYDGPPRADRVDSGGGGACFIESASR
jgi:hypothetical protein